MDFVTEYDFIDKEKFTKYPEQQIGIKQLSRHKFAISMAIVDVSCFFDPRKNFNENIKSVCEEDFHRAQAYFKNEKKLYPHSERTNAFHCSYSAGTRTLYDKITLNKLNMPYICFDTIVDLKKNDKDLNERIEPLKTAQYPITTSGRYSFASFEKEKPCIKTILDFIQKIKEIPEMHKLCLFNTTSEKLSVGNVYSATINFIIKTAASNLANEKKIALLVNTYQKNKQGQIIDKNYMTLEKYKSENKKTACSRITAPLSDPAAAYTIHQFKKVSEGKYPEGQRQAERVESFLNDQRKNFVLMPPILKAC